MAPNFDLKAFLVSVSILVLIGCGNAARDTRLSGLDLNDRRLVSSLGVGLSARERAALTTYALLHWPGSKAFCGHSVFYAKRQPMTVGEAVDLTIAFEDGLAAKRTAEINAFSPGELREARERKLVNEFDQLTLDRDKLEASSLGYREKARQLRYLDERLEANRRLREALPSGALF